MLATLCCQAGDCALSVAARLSSPVVLDALASALDAAGVGVAVSGGVAVVAASARGDLKAVERLLARDTDRRLLRPLGGQPSRSSLGCLASAATLAMSKDAVPGSASLAAPGSRTTPRRR